MVSFKTVDTYFPVLRDASNLCNIKKNIFVFRLFEMRCHDASVECGKTLFFTVSKGSTGSVCDVKSLSARLFGHFSLLYK